MSRTLNQTTLVGNVMRDPVRTAEGDVPVTRFTIATDRGEERDVHRIAAYARLAFTAMEIVQKGALVMVQGRLRYLDDGRTAEVIARELIVMSPREAVN